MKQAHGERYLLLVLAALAGLVGYYGPWVPHKAAGLVVTGLDLAEYVKFLPQVRSDEIRLQREIFYLPLVACSAGAALLASRRSLPTWLRVVFALTAIPLALAMLPPAWSPATFTDPEYRLQVIAIVLCLALVPGILVTRHVATRVILVVLAILFVAAAIVPFWGFLQVHPPIETLYHQPLPIGWGAWANLAGFLVAALAALAEVLRRE